MPIYLAKSIAPGAARSQAFSAKSIPNFTMALLSEVPQLAKATSTELAYSGYKDALEAFLFSTAMNTRVSTQAGFFPLPEFNPSIPLPIPPIVFRSRTLLSAAQVTAIQKRFEDSGIKSLPVGAGPQGFVVERPSWADLNAISRLSGDNTTNPGSTIQQSAITPLRTLYKCIELFLRTNTYYYRRTEALTRVGGTSQAGVQGSIDDLTAIALPASIWFITDKKRKAVPMEEGIFRRIRDKEVAEDESLRHRVTMAPGMDSVLVAKPSPKPFNASLGSASQVPFEPGLLFPYFHGMITCDTRGLRSIVAKLFFRNFGGQQDSDAREGYKEFRENAGIISSSSMGPIIGHILKGFEIALEAQAHAFLLFDDSHYLGFALLGDHYYVHDGMKWVEPLEASALKEELRELHTHETTLEGIVVLLGLMKDHDKNPIDVDVVEISTPSGLLDVLATVDEAQGDSVKELGKLIQGLKFKGSFKEISPQNVCWAMDHLTNNLASSLGDLNLYIPLSDWSRCSSREYQVFAAFGPRAFHLQNKRGQKFAVPRLETDVDPLGALSGDPPRPVYPKILIYPCPIQEAVRKWEIFLSDGIVCFDFDERAKGSRAIVWESGNRNLVWDRIKMIGKGGFIKERVGGAPSKAIGKKRERPADFDDGEFDEILNL